MNEEELEVLKSRISQEMMCEDFGGIPEYYDGDSTMVSDEKLEELAYRNGYDTVDDWFDKVRTNCPRLFGS